MAKEVKSKNLNKSGLSSIEQVIEEAKQGRIFILVDDENRENEGDLCIPAEMATSDVINFMAKYARGLICLAMERSRVEQLGLSLMARRNEGRHETAFTVSIEAREGVTTGISAHDRAHTISVATNVNKGQDDIVTPGHVFPLVARDGGSLVRAGHTEAVVDIARLAGLTPAGVICEIMNDDGTMARLPDLLSFAQQHDLKVATIADLISYRRRTESIVERSLESVLDSRYGGSWRMIIYLNKVTYAEHIALIKGDITGETPILVRMHSLNVMEDVLGDQSGSRGGGELQSAMRHIADVGRGVVVVMREPTSTALSEKIRGKIKTKIPEGGTENELRDYGVGAQILLDLGIKEMILLTNSEQTVIGLEGYGLSIFERQTTSISGMHTV
ncbi:MAG: 3,4-dihydroxy-2-butanone-4-phosphate synthase [Rhodospirillaceae bacterium]|jgi:3,4-dihydroxy 2-butanone 4-phosphate synthase/GTP cyclohydrolase II|nr:3,4-dihydroxy-2-butanone-4-phosphate synthase [Rhodospirillaceae bacterium]OUU61906.1 MAG: 3,4-dihydroxy-2-butanone-4-phosphate synthase [Candidatus Endolissoclinum sp. TMED55]|tara:strand:+ start:3736 stop:4899 length:1164 start_codon:yes stop_codon:yes gene_type:complete